MEPSIAPLTPTRFSHFSSIIFGNNTELHPFYVLLFVPRRGNIIKCSPLSHPPPPRFNHEQDLEEKLSTPDLGSRLHDKKASEETLQSVRTSHWDSCSHVVSEVP
ncbi:hypothetical protein RND71_008392 [Anisodus tanguticus]|uniref:Uncharacterized protein n=1 Tax=Anisodus tanguticus TaxID=243964 RepID=A0AAE1SP03_9SOLA|nr:hypothetical protein RND71_008392 [Anisodus tanguticus]